MYTRTNVYANGGNFNDPVILWYARGVAAMQKIALNQPTSWGFYAAIHGFNVSVWEGVDIPASPIPPVDVQRTYWNQCQHGSWYFLPWHRGYLLGLEAVVRSFVVAAGGPSDWALPYWNYFDPNENQLPPAFASTTWPDSGANPLYTPERYGPNGDGNVYVDLSEVNLDAMALHYFTGTTKGSPGFGGLDTGFSHSGRNHGAIEQQPHDYVHGLVGGQQGNQPSGALGWMSVPTTAGFDPIFWLHHANIDRLWAVWNTLAPGNSDPIDPKWVNGPVSIGEREFIVPLPAGKDYVYTPGMVEDIVKLGYTYSELALPAAAAPQFAAAAQSRAEMMAKKVELVGATQGSVPVEGTEIHASVSLDSATRQTVVKSFSVASEAVAEPDRLYLHLEDIRGGNDATRFAVYVGLPQGASAAEHPEYKAGHLALFGLREASDPDGGHGGHGISLVLDITKIVAQLNLSEGFDVDKLDVRLVPSRPVAKEDAISIGRISVYREGQ